MEEYNFNNLNIGDILFFSGINFLSKSMKILTYSDITHTAIIVGIDIVYGPIISHCIPFNENLYKIKTLNGDYKSGSQNVYLKDYIETKTYDKVYIMKYKEKANFTIQDINKYLGFSYEQNKLEFLYEYLGDYGTSIRSYINDKNNGYYCSEYVSFLIKSLNIIDLDDINNTVIDLKNILDKSGKYNEIELLYENPLTIMESIFGFFFIFS